MSSDLERFEHFFTFVGTNPELLELAPPGAGEAELKQRIAEGRRCMRGCPDTDIRGAYLLGTREHGMRWLDLCHPCALLFRQVLDRGARTKKTGKKFRRWRF